jgi:hypothetical protein
MFKFSCKDLNLNCDYTAIGENRINERDHAALANAVRSGRIEAQID